MLVMVVGASGVVGQQLVPQLLAAGHTVVATTRSSPAPAAAERLSHRRLDLLDADAVTALVHEVRPDAIVHQATALRTLGNNLRRFDQLFSVTTSCGPRARRTWSTRPRAWAGPGCWCRASAAGRGPRSAAR